MKHKQDWKADGKNEPKENTEETVTKNSAEELPDAEVEVTDPVSKLEAELTNANDKYLRLYSEFENYKRRMAKDRIEQSKMAGAEIFLSLIPIMDDFERAIKSIDESSDTGHIIEGIKLIHSKIKAFADSKGLKEMKAVGTLFDPDIHDAIANAPVTSEDQKGTVVEEIEKGYLLNDRVIRHAKVIVGN